jgi:hypothetical protein
MLLIQSDNTSTATETDIDLLLIEAFRNAEIAEYLERVTDIDEMLIDAFDGLFDEWYEN